MSDKNAALRAVPSYLNIDVDYIETSFAYLNIKGAAYG